MMIEKENKTTLKIIGPIERVGRCLAKSEELGLRRSEIDKERLLVKKQGLRTNYLGWTSIEILDILAVQTFGMAWNNLNMELDDDSFDLFIKIRNLAEKYVN